jgi:GT2 family glycosyltransferase
MEKPSVTVIVLNWNGKDLTIECLESLKQVNYSNFNILVVDNGSTDGSVELLKEKFPEVSILVLEKNLGYAAGNNRGFDSLKPDQPEFVIFLNNDTIVDENFIEPLVKQLLTHKKASQTVPKIYYENDPKLIWYAGGIVNLWTGSIYHLGIRQYDGPAYSKTHKTKYATGCCFCMRYEEFKEFGGFDEAFPMYSEDVDLSLWIRAAGKQVWFVPNSKIWHKVSASLGGEFSFGKIVRKARGIFLLIKKHANVVQWLTLIVLLPIQLIIVLLKLIFKVGR